MGNPWKKIRRYGVDENTNNWNQRNLRLMNSMVFVLCCSMIMFAGLSIAMTGGAMLPMLGISFTTSALYFLLVNRVSIQFTKIYFCLLPALIICMFSIFGVGEIGNDRYYLIDVLLLPLIVFKKRSYYLPIVVFVVVAFFSTWYIQTQIEPFVELSGDLLIIYKSINVVMIFIFLLVLIGLFKDEINGYQKEIENQKHLVEEKNKEITESITYARRIQEAILPVQERFEKELPENHVLYLPKDIVAGDFYWLETSGDHVFFAAADCTGHGVPGAMVSVVCHGALNRAVREFGLKEPAKILDKVREIVIETFSENDDSVKDGMDIALCKFDKKTRNIEFAGANNGLYLIRNDELSETKADKQPIGSFDHPTPFTNRKIETQEGDVIYLFSDGFADQFGGPKGKKFKYKPFKQLLTNISPLKMEDQQRRIKKVFDEWKGDFEQVDDVCVIGVRV